MFLPAASVSRWHKPIFPPRIYILTSESVFAFAHPASGFSSFTAPLNELVEVSCYKALLHGELSFVTTSVRSEKLLYGPVQHKFIDPFLHKLSALWLPDSDAPFGPDIEHRLRRMESRCIAALHIDIQENNESVIQFCYQKSFPRRSRRRLFLGHEVVAARLLARTSRRLVMIVEGQEDIETDSGITIKWTHIDYLSHVRRERNQLLYGFTLIFSDDTSWQFWMSDEAEISAMEAILDSLGHRNSRGAASTDRHITAKTT